jgi:hypothetical protein
MSGFPFRNSRRGDVLLRHNSLANMLAQNRVARTLLSAKS